MERAALRCHRATHRRREILRDISTTPGVSTPPCAGPNPQRKFSANNTGNLAIVAQLKDGERALEGRAHLIVTVQRWNTPPIY